MTAAAKSFGVSPGHLQEASDWLIRLQGEDVDDQAVAEWLDWCRTDPTHLEAFNEVQRLYDQLQTVDSGAREQFLKSTSIPEATTTVRLRDRRFLLRPKVIIWTGLAAGIVACVLVMAVLRSQHLERTAIEAADYRASPGAQQALVLADRSRVTIGSASEVVSHFTTGTRAVELKAGEAYFEVQPDHSRPFVVRAGSVTVTAVGTKFDVRRTRERIIVSVTEGAVDVVADSAGQVEKRSYLHSEALATPVRVSAGQQAVRAITQAGLTLTDIDPAAVTAWRDGRLEYVMEPLSSVIDDVNRYGRHPIEIRDAQLRDLVFTGTVFRDQIDAWAFTLGSAFPLKATVGADGVIILEARSEK